MPKEQKYLSCKTMFFFFKKLYKSEARKAFGLSIVHDCLGIIRETMIGGRGGDQGDFLHPVIQLYSLKNRNGARLLADVLCIMYKKKTFSSSLHLINVIV